MAGPLGGAVGRPAAATTEVEDVDGGPLGVLAKVRQQPPPEMKKTPMVGPWGVLSVVRQWPPLKLKTSMVFQ
jgi:hypothetical protein